MENLYMDTREAAHLLHLSTNYLVKLLVYGGGPPFIKFGKKVVYSRDDLINWANSKKQMSTSWQSE